ncbi:delta-60 repeat domain-containing protein, partial [Candidatus Gracilibacteria bacterium]|nr:delta-60 repeat domain-containing protein [Candidatus Gracilibacteria bacterium]
MVTEIFLFDENLIHIVTTYNNIVRLRPDGTVDTNFNVGNGFNNDVYAIYIQNNGEILVGGNFTSYKGSGCNYIVRLRSDGAIESTFYNSIGNGFNGPVKTIDVQSDGKILVGGAFSQFNSSSYNNIVRLASDGHIDNTFMVGGGFNGSVYSIDIDPTNKILVGGAFTLYSGDHFNRITRLQSDGLADPGFNNFGNAFNGGSDFVNSVLFNQYNGKILVGGYFSSYDGNSSNNIVSIENDGSYDSNFSVGNGFSNYVNYLTLQSDEKILVGGSFTTYDGDPSRGIARLMGTYTPGGQGGSFTGTFVINNNAATTTSQSVTLNMSTTPAATYMRFQNDVTTGSWSSWMTYATSTGRTLSAGTGTKTVYVQFDEDGDQQSDLQESDSISYVVSGNNCVGGVGIACLYLEITATTGSCIYGDNLDLGNHAQTYSAFTMTGNFLNTSAGAKRSCNDSAGKAPRTMQISATDLIIGNYSISSGLIEVLASAPTIYQ